jgi:hypothetical protein
MKFIPQELTNLNPNLRKKMIIISIFHLRVVPKNPSSHNLQISLRGPEPSITKERNPKSKIILKAA